MAHQPICPEKVSQKDCDKQNKKRTKRRDFTNFGVALVKPADIENHYDPKHAEKDKEISEVLHQCQKSRTISLR